MVNEERIYKWVEILKQIKYMRYLTREASNEKIYLFLLLMHERELVDVEIPAKSVEREEHISFLDMLDQLQLVYVIKDNGWGGVNIIIARSVIDLRKFQDSPTERADEIFGYPPTAVQSFVKNRKECFEAEEEHGAISKEMREYLYRHILSRKEQQEVLKKEFPENKLYWFLNSIAMSSDLESQKKELEKYREWQRLLKKYKII